MKTVVFTFLLLCFNLKGFAGHYLEFRISSGKMSGGTMKTWYQNKNARSEILMKIPGSSELKAIVTLTLSQNPELVYLVDESTKTYSVLNKNKDQKSSEDNSDDYEFTIIGPEKVNGYNSTHVRAKSKKGTTTMDWWMSREVKGYEQIKDLKTKEIDAAMWTKGLAGKGVEGFPVRIVVNASKNDEVSSQMDLIKSEIAEIPASKFSLEGYTQSEGNPLMPAGLDPEKIKNMTPEERQKFMEEMMRKYQR